MKKPTGFEINEENKTGRTCLETGLYFCKTHPYIEKFIQRGEAFPKCDQKNIPHNATWYKLINS